MPLRYLSGRHGLESRWSMSTKGVPEGWEAIGRDGELHLYASPDRAQGVLFNQQTRAVTGPPQPLQIFFKWGNFTEMEETDRED